MNLKSEGESYWGTKMRAKWDTLTSWLHVDHNDDMVIGQGILGDQALYLQPAGLFLDSHVIFAAHLPTTDPQILDQIWNDNGTVKISAG